jgi:hypothetical protein
MPNSNNDENKTIAVIGAGVMGLVFALLLKEFFGDEFEVVIFEAREEPLKGSSDGTPNRMGLGYHYPDIATALLYQKYTIEFAKKFPDCITKDDKKGEYYINPRSLVQVSDLLAVYEQISEKFRQYAEEDPDIKNIFGDDSFGSHRFMRRGEIPKHINADEVAVGLKTTEKTLDFEQFSKTILEKLEKFNVKIRCGTKITRIIKKVNEKGHGFELGYNQDVMVEKKRKKLADESRPEGEFYADYVVECTWNNSRKIVDQYVADNNLPPPNIPNFSQRLKILLVVKLPPLLLKMNHAFFCVGPFAMVTNEADQSRGKELAKVTYAPITNVLGSDEIDGCKDEERKELWSDIYQKLGRNITREEWDELVNNDGITDDMLRVIGPEIIKGVAKYIPDMLKATAIKLNAGYVLSTQCGDQEISSKNSMIHKRSESGINIVTDGIWSAKAMKLFGCVTAGKELIEMAFPVESKQRKIELDSKAKHKEFVEKFSMICKSLNRAEDQNITPSEIRNFENVFNSGCEYNQRNTSRTPSSSSFLQQHGSPTSSLSPSASPLSPSCSRRKRRRTTDDEQGAGEVLLVNALMNDGKDLRSSARGI